MEDNKEPQTVSLPFSYFYLFNVTLGNLSTEQCFDLTCLSVEKNRFTDISWSKHWHELECNLFDIGVSVCGHTDSGKTHFSLSSSDNSIISNWDAGLSATKGAFKQSDSAVKGLIRKLICGLFAMLHNMQLSCNLSCISTCLHQWGEVECGTVSACWQKKKCNAQDQAAILTFLAGLH